MHTYKTTAAIKRHNISILHKNLPMAICSLPSLFLASGNHLMAFCYYRFAFSRFYINGMIKWVFIEYGFFHSEYWFLHQSILQISASVFCFCFWFLAIFKEVINILLKLYYIMFDRHLIISFATMNKAAMNISIQTSVLSLLLNNYLEP